MVTTTNSEAAMAVLEEAPAALMQQGLSDIDLFFAKREILGEGLDYDDAVIRSGRSGTLVPKAVNLATWFSRTVPLRVPLVGAAMDTVTESPMAIALACAGGIGVIHRNFSPEEQAREVDAVKYFLNGLIVKPKCIRDASWTIAQVLRWREEKERKYRFHTFPVIDADGKLIGLLTGSDIRFCKDRWESVTVREAMERDITIAPVGCSKEKALAMMRASKKNKLPLVEEDGTLAGMYTLFDLERTERDTSHNTDADGQLRVGAAIGVGDAAFERAELLIEHNVDVLVVDTAHAWSNPVSGIVRKIKRYFPDTDVVVGNVTEAGATEELIHDGADGIKVGQGVGSICSTTEVTGVGRPQLTAVYECAFAAKKHGIPVCADGGVRFQSDITKALAAGAGSVMLGNLLAGHDESPGDIIEVNGIKYKTYRGMGSEAAIRGNLDRYHQGGKEVKEGVMLAEGVEGKVLYKGSVARTIGLLLAGVQSGMSAIGAATIAELRAIAKFEKLSEAAAKKTHPHSIVL